MDTVFDLNEKTILITGASSGIGKALSIKLSEYGSRIVLLARSEEKLDSIVEFINSSSKSNAFAYPCDLGEEESLLSTLKLIKSEVGIPDIIVNNAGVGSFNRITKMGFREIVNPLKVPLEASLIITWFFLKECLGKHPHFIYVTGPVSFVALPFMISYTTARYGLRGMVRALQEEHKNSSNQFSLICFGPVKTDYVTINNSDLNWYPIISKLIPPIEKEKAADIIVKVIFSPVKETIFPNVLKTFLIIERIFPLFFLKILKILGLMTPPKLRRNNN